jgi:hypothetical protein
MGHWQSSEYRNWASGTQQGRDNIKRSKDRSSLPPEPIAAEWFAKVTASVAFSRETSFVSSQRYVPIDLIACPTIPPDRKGASRDTLRDVEGVTILIGSRIG